MKHQRRFQFNLVIILIVIFKNSKGYAPRDYTREIILSRLRIDKNNPLFQKTVEQSERKKNRKMYLIGIVWAKQNEFLLGSLILLFHGNTC